MEIDKLQDKKKIKAKQIPEKKESLDNDAFNKNFQQNQNTSFQNYIFHREFDITFQFLLVAQYFSLGLKIIAIISTEYLFKDEFQLNPSDAQYMFVIGNIPGSLKLLYGLVIDNFKICNSRKKSLMLLGAFLQFITFQTLFWYQFQRSEAIYVAILLFSLNVSHAFMDMVVDTIMIDQSKNDQLHGAENLQSMVAFSHQYGAIIGGILGGFIIKYFHPQFSYLFLSSLTLIVAFTSTFLSQEIDKKGIQNMKGFYNELLRSFHEILKIRYIPEIYLTLLWIVLSSFFTPSFTEFNFYYNTNVRQISKPFIGALKTIGSFSTLLGVFIFKYFLKDMEFRNGFLVGQMVLVIGKAIWIAFINKYTLDIGISDEAFLIIDTVIFQSLTQAFAAIPLRVLFIKICPEGIEGTVYAALLGTANFSHNVVQPMVGSFLNDRFIGVTYQNIGQSAGFYNQQIVSLCFAVIPALIICMIPTKLGIQNSKIAYLKKHQDENEQESLIQKN